MTIRERLKILRMVYKVESLNELLITMEKIDMEHELSIWDTIYTKNELYEMIKEITSKQQLNDLLKWIEVVDFKQNNYFYKNSEDNYFPADEYKDLILEEIEDDLWDYFEKLEDNNE